MGLELVGGAKKGEGSGRGEGETLSEAERQVSETRQRLGALIERLAELRLRLGPTEGGGGNAETPGSVPSLEMPSS